MRTAVCKGAESPEQLRLEQLGCGSGVGAAGGVLAMHTSSVASLSTLQSIASSLGCATGESGTTAKSIDTKDEASTTTGRKNTALTNDCKSRIIFGYWPRACSLLVAWLGVAQLSQIRCTKGSFH